MAAETVRIEGLSEALRMLESLPAEIVSKRGGPVRFALRKAAVILQKEIRGNIDQIIATPNVDGSDTKSTGALKASVAIKRRKMGMGQKGERFDVGIFKLSKAYANNRKNVRSGRAGKNYEVLPPTYYAWFLEYGTEKMTAKPFMRPAFDSKRESVVSAFRDELFKKIDAIKGKLGR
jgi:HK97 gp10 family phage protein